MKNAVYRWIALIILVVGIIPTASSFYQGVPVATPQVVLRIPEIIAGAASVQSGRKTKHVKKVFNTTDWTERIYTDAEGNRITLFVARGFDPRPLFHFPENGLLTRDWSERDYSIDNASVEGVDYRIHQLVLKGLNTNQQARYLFLHAGRVVGNPYLYLLKSIPITLFHGRRPYTMVFVSYHSQGNKNVDQEALTILMEAAQRVG